MNSRYCLVRYRLSAMDLSFKKIVWFSMLLCCGTWLTGCLPDPLVVDGIPVMKPKIVVSSRVTSDETVVVLLTKSVGALEASEDSDPEELLELITLNDAEVTIEHNGISYELTSIGNGLYGSVEIPLQPGDDYFLSVESPTLGTVTASTKVMEKVDFNSVDARTFDNGYDTLAEVTFTFNDPVGKNYYMLNVQHLTREGEAEDLLNPDMFTYLMDDIAFENQEYYGRQRAVTRRDFKPGDTVGLFLSNINKEYYDFMRTRLDSRFNFSDFLGEPLNYPTNVKGGLGFFNLYIPDVRILELEE
jgi:hypothetical protein